MLSVIIPAYNEEAMLEKSAAVITGILSEAKITCELLFVDDGSKDQTWMKIQMASEKYPQVRGVHFSRNFPAEPQAGRNQPELRFALRVFPGEGRNSTGAAIRVNFPSAPGARLTQHALPGR